jgi:hypothetical protein
MIKKITYLLFIFFSLSCYSQDLTATLKTDNSVVPGKDIFVEITINKPGLNGFMKYFQELPEGFSASAVETKGGDFTFADKGAKIIWVSPPSDDQMIISYKITTPLNASGTINVGGKFSYVVSNERRVFDIVPQTVSLGKSAPTVVAKEPVKEQIKETPVKENPVIETKPKLEGTKTTEPKKETPPVVNTTPAKAPATAATIAPGRTYRVQIGAFSSKPKIDGVFELTTIVLDNGVTKYFSGNFKTYEEAAKRKKEMIDKGFQGAFVVSFESGKIVK